jgi:hypothetical protein
MQHVSPIGQVQVASAVHDHCQLLRSVAAACTLVPDPHLVDVMLLLLIDTSESGSSTLMRWYCHSNRTVTPCVTRVHHGVSFSRCSQAGRAAGDGD